MGLVTAVVCHTANAPVSCWRVTCAYMASVLVSCRHGMCDGRTVGGGGWFWRCAATANMPCPAALAVPRHATAGLLIRSTVTAVTRMHGVLRSARQLHSLICQQRHTRTGAGPKKGNRNRKNNL